MTLFEPIANLRYYTHLSQITKKGNLLCPLFSTETPLFLLKRTESPNHFQQNMLQAISLPLMLKFEHPDMDDKRENGYFVTRCSHLQPISHQVCLENIIDLLVILTSEMSCKTLSESMTHQQCLATFVENREYQRSFGFVVSITNNSKIVGPITHKAVWILLSFCFHHS